MPLYDFECPHGHRFEKQVKIADREEPVPCEGKVNQLVLEGVSASSVQVDGEEFPVREVPCILKAWLVVGSHNNPHASLLHGSASNRDAAREGRYDPLKPNTRFMAKGRSWRK